MARFPAQHEAHHVVIDSCVSTWTMCGVAHASGILNIDQEQSLLTPEKGSVSVEHKSPALLEIDHSNVVHK